MDPQRHSFSIIVTGSDMNHRTFGDEESWNSLQSTVLAGNLTLSDTTDVERRKDLTTVDEENLEGKDDIDCTQYEDILNTNIDAIGSDEEAFFDCYPSYSPRYSPMKSKSPTALSAGFQYSPKHSPMIAKLTSSTANFQCGNFLTIGSVSEINQTSTFDSGLDERTGSLLAQMVEDFNNIRSESRSTPNLDKEISDQINDKTSEIMDSKRKLSFSSEEPSVTKQKVAKAKNKKGTNSPAEWKPARRVAKMKEFFENKSKTAEESRGNQTSRTSTCVKKSLIPTSSSRIFSNNTRNVPKLMKTPFRSRSPTYKIMSVPKLVVTPARKSIDTPENKSRSRFLRPSSCSDYSSESSDVSHSQKSRSHSSSDIECNASASVNNSTKLTSSTLRNAIKTKAVSTRPYFTVNRKSPTNQSAISKRRSVGIAAKSKTPIKPVRELRKVFSPPFNNANKVRKSTK